MKVGLGFQRLVFFMIIFIVLCHVLTCIWVFTGQFTNEEDASWMDEFEGSGNGALYISSIYYTLTTITTVGYGDITGVNTLEQTVSICIMIIGVISFSFATGSLSSILQNYD